MKFQRAEDVRAIAEELILDHRRDLGGQYMLYVFHEKAATKNGKLVLATANKMTGLAALLIRGLLPANDPVEPSEAEFFYVSVALDTWLRLNDWQRRALIYHELKHFWVDKNGETEKLELHGHDWEGFNEEVAMFGLWRPDLKSLAAAVKRGAQIELPMDEAAPELVTA